MPRMTDDEALEFISSRPRTGKLATNRLDGSPHVVPVWVVVDGGDLLFNVGESSLKAKAMRRDPRVSICFDDEAPPFAFVSIDGTVAITDDLDDMRVWATKIGGRYMGADRADEFGARNAVPGELLVRLTPTRIVAQSGVAD